MGGSDYQDEPRCDSGCDCKSDSPNEGKTTSKYCMVEPGHSCKSDECMAWARSADGKSGQCIHGIFKQMVMTSLGAIVNIISGTFGVAQPPKEKESSIVTPNRKF